MMLAAPSAAQLAGWRDSQLAGPMAHLKVAQKVVNLGSHWVQW
jgi:hypothetical protein